MRFWRKAIFFGDGAKGMAMQGFAYHCGPTAQTAIDTGVRETATRAYAGAQWQSVFGFRDVEYGSLEKALDAWKAVQPTGSAEASPGQASGSAD